MNRNIIILSTSLLLILLLACGNKEDINNTLVKKHAVSSADSIQIEIKLTNYRKCLCAEVFYRSRETTYKRMHIEIDSTRDLTYYFYPDINMKWLSKDINRDILLKNWLGKKEYTPIAEPPDHPDGSLDLARTLDFYESEDLKNYIDSLRITEYKRISAISKSN